MTGIGPGVEFLARYAESEGGLADLGPDGALLLLPEHLSRSLSVPEALRVTADPEVAREDGTLLVFAGHPLLRSAAQAVLERGDVGCAYLPRPAALPPTRDVLELKAREHVHADHGRLDVVAPPEATDLIVLRAAALVTYTTSVDRSVQEVEEVWVAPSTCQEVPPALRAVLSGAAIVPGAEDLSMPPEAGLAAAGSLLHERVVRRAEALRRETSSRLQQQLKVVDDYYERVLASLGERRERAVERKAELLGAQVEATKAEWSRRRAEVTEELTPTVTTHPFRLHVLRLPAYQVGCVVRRGAREYPLNLTYVQSTSSFLVPACPSCGAPVTLVAGKERLGCRSCLGGQNEREMPPAPGSSTAPQSSGPQSSGPQSSGPQSSGPQSSGPQSSGPQSSGPQSSGPQSTSSGRPADRPGGADVQPAQSKPAQSKPAQSKPAQSKPAQSKPAQSKPAQSALASQRPGPALDGRARTTSGRVTPKGAHTKSTLSKMGLNLASSFWQAVWSGDVARRAKVLPGSSLEALLRLYGPIGPALVVGAHPLQRPQHIETSTEDAGDGTTVTDGELGLLGGDKVHFALYWGASSGALIEVEAFPLEYFGPMLVRDEPPFGTALRRRLAAFLGPLPPPMEQLSPVADALVERAASWLGLAYAARCMAAWWYLTEGAGERPATWPDAGDLAQAAAIELLVAKRAGARATAPAVADRYGCSHDDVRRFERKAQVALGGARGLRW